MTMGGFALLLRWIPWWQAVALAVTALALIATCRGLGSVAFHASPDLDQLCKAAVSLVFDRVAGG
jgi:hypothetical protein